MNKTFLLWVLCFVLLFFHVGGCQRGITRVSIEGKVVYQGEPLAGGEITFKPEAGPGCGAVMDDRGNFKVDKKYGPMPGKCQIMIEKIEQMSIKGSDGRTSTEKRSTLPDKFYKQPKTITLEKGHNKIEINLDDWE